MTVKADTDTDARYKFLRDKHGEANPQANGYRVGSFFDREQRVLLSVLDRNLGPFMDVACGSGLMLSPLLGEGHDVYGLDFNEDACVGAHQNGIKIMRGDAFSMPLPDGSIGQIVNCQFLNQQPVEETKKFIEESARVLKSGGQLIILWRHARSFAHKSAHAVFTFMDKFTGQPPFPQYEHPMEEIRTFGENAGLKTVHEAVTLPFLQPDYIKSDSVMANLVGASLFIVLKKP